MSDPILIAGGGLGGLATALALGRKGRRVQVLEQSPNFGAIGYGIQLGPNVFAMLEHLGVAETVEATSHLPPAILFLDAFTGEDIIRVPTDARFRRRFGRPYGVIHRVDLHEILLEACRALPNISLRPCATLAAHEDDGERVVVRTAEGETFAGAALVGADGLNSRIRPEIAPPDDVLVPIGYAAHRAIVARKDLAPHVFRDEVILWAGPGFHIVCYPLRGGRLYNVVAVFRTPTHAQRQDPAALKREVAETYRDTHPDMQALLRLIPFERRWTISDRDPLGAWSKGRVTLLGDAAHPTLQSLAQGAGMAIEDGVWLAECVGDGRTPLDAAFRAYERNRITRCARVQLESRTLWAMYHCGGVAAAVRKATFAERTAEDYYRWLAWLYDGPDFAAGSQAPHDGLRKDHPPAGSFS